MLPTVLATAGVGISGIVLCAGAMYLMATTCVNPNQCVMVQVCAVAVAALVAGCTYLLCSCIYRRCDKARAHAAHMSDNDADEEEEA